MRRLGSPGRYGFLETASTLSSRAGDAREPARLAGQLKDEEPGVRPVDGIDQAAVVHLHVIDLDLYFAVHLINVVDTAAISLGGGGRDVVGDLARAVGVAHVEHPHPGVEPGEEHQPLVVEGREVLLGRVRAEAPAAGAEVAARLPYRV